MTSLRSSTSPSSIRQDQFGGRCFKLTVQTHSHEFPTKRPSGSHPIRYIHDHSTMNLLEHVKEGKMWRFWHENGLLSTRGHRIYVLYYDSHDSKWAGHPSMHRTLALVKENYYWPHLHDDVEAHVRTCLVCQQDKMEHKASADLLDFIVGLPKSNGFGTIMVIVNRFSKPLWT